MTMFQKKRSGWTIREEGEADKDLDDDNAIQLKPSDQSLEKNENDEKNYKNDKNDKKRSKKSKESSERKPVAESFDYDAAAAAAAAAAKHKDHKTKWPRMWRLLTLLAKNFMFTNARG
jgi:hypothetical protein